MKLPQIPITVDKIEALLVYTCFHRILRRSNALVGIARRRIGVLGETSIAAALHVNLLTLCRSTYCGAREGLLTITVWRHMDILRERYGLVDMTRLTSVFLIKLCTIETALYLDFFGNPKKQRYRKETGNNAAVSKTK